ncbi:MAG: histidine triad nucleotide-binding protein [Waddliaceae bacterium]|nr:histidine triad nucleotide-binding protein [Waddliaceae bacterium]
MSETEHTPTLFEKIIEGELPSEKVFENEHLVAFKDIHPVAPVHILIVPRKAIPDFQSIEKDDLFLLQELGKVAQHLAKEFDIADGYRLLTNIGPQAGQTVFHLHFHLIGGRRLGPLA